MIKKFFPSPKNGRIDNILHPVVFEFYLKTETVKTFYKKKRIIIMVKTMGV